MGEFRLGSVFGFEIRIDYSWFIIFFLILWTFTFAVFPANFPNLGVGAYIGMGVVSTVLFFVSLLIHEISHSLVARRRGVPIEGITLFVFGGVSKTRSEAKSPGDEFAIAIVGPLASIVLGVIFWVIGSIGIAGQWGLPVIGSARYLGALNFALGIFNMIPGFPLDGGRVLRSIIWKVTGNMTTATRYASLAGQVIGYLLIALGVIEIFAVNVVGGIWLAFIGWFLRNAAIVSYRQHVLQGELEHVRAEEMMTRDPETLPRAMTLQQAVDEHFLKRPFVAFPVMEGEHPVGMVTLNQIREVPRETWGERSVGEVMTPLAAGIEVRPEQPMTEVLEKMEAVETHRVLVTRNGHLEGIITGVDLNNWLRRTQGLEQGRGQGPGRRAA
jgi:Zn-dependent protease/CBS domain-containing protein